MTDLAYHRLCSLTGMPQELIRHPHCGPERFAEAVSAVLTSQRRSFYDVLTKCLNAHDRADLYRTLLSRNGSSVSDHVHYAEFCRTNDRARILRTLDAVRDAAAAVFRKSSEPPENGVIDALVNTVLAGFPENITKEQILACLQRVEREQYHETSEDSAAPSQKKRRRSGRRHNKNGSGTAASADPITARVRRM